MSSFGRTTFQFAYEISPIILVDGIASQIAGGMLPIVALTEAVNFTEGLLQGNLERSLDEYFAHWKPLPGSTVIQNVIAPFPFANQGVAGNAAIAQPLNVSMLMACPVNKEGGYLAKLATMTMVTQSLAQHNAMGGTYIVATPSQFYPSCVLTSVRDVSTGESKQVQTAYQFDFVQPLITLNQVEQVYSSLMAKIGGGLPISGQPTWSGIDIAPPVPLSNVSVTPLA